VRLEESQKIVSFESLLVIANNHDTQELKLCVKETNQDDHQIRSN
jgi:hypothetical protein